MDTTLPPDFKDFLRLLNGNAVDYLLVGGYAVAYYGYPRATADMDVWVAIAPVNAQRAVQALREFGFDIPELSQELFLLPDKVASEDQQTRERAPQKSRGSRLPSLAPGKSKTRCTPVQSAPRCSRNDER